MIINYIIIIVFVHVLYSNVAKLHTYNAVIILKYFKTRFFSDCSHYNQRVYYYDLQTSDFNINTIKVLLLSIII